MNFATLTQGSSQQTQEPLAPMLTLESIAYQRNDKFGPQLESLMTEYMQLVDRGATADQIEGNVELKNRFEKTIKDRLGITVVFICDKLLAACMPNVYTAHSSVLRDAMRKMIEPYGAMMGLTELRSLKSGDKIGTVNTETAKISGWLGEQVIPLFMNFNDLKNYGVWTSGELTAICLHELGHIFDSAAKAYTVNNVNQIIHDVVKHVSDKNRGGDIEYIYAELNKLDPDLTRETVEGLNSKSTVVFGISAFRVIQGSVRTLSGSKVYDRTSSEALADSFAVRFGYAESLAVGLERIMNDRGLLMTELLFQAMNAFVFGSIVKSLFHTLAAISTGGLATIGLIGIQALLSNIFGLYAMTVTNRYSMQDYEYDKNSDRIRRIQNDLINSLKNSNISKETKITVLEQLKTLEKVRSNVFEIPNVVQLAILAFFKTDRQSYVSVKAQQQIESLLANQLFVQAAKLETKA